MSAPTLNKSGCIDEIFDKYSDMIFRIALSHVHSREDARDICQDVFMKYLKDNTVFESDEHLKNWFIRVTINCCKNLCGSSWFRKNTSYNGNENYSDSPFEEFDKRADVHNALQKIPVKYRTVIHLFYFEDYSIKEISDILKIKESTIKSQLMRGKKLLYDLLKGEYFNE